jgi:putative flippase GtrA
MQAVANLALRLTDIRLVRYGFASAGALAVDMGLFLALLSLGLAAAAASAGGYLAGIAAHWLLSSRAVFAGRVAERGRARLRQKGLFVGSALAGLAVTTAIVWAGDRSGLDPRLAKLAAVAVSFTITWVLRSRMVFR